MQLVDIADIEELSWLVERQLANMFCYTDAKGITLPYQHGVMAKLEKCFAYTSNKYYSNDTDTTFSPFHSAQYSIYLYHLSNIVYRKEGTNPLSERLYLLNKALHGVDWYYTVELPDVFIVEHPVGSVMGRAKYSNKFCFFQGCTIGGNKGKYPRLGEHVTLYAGSRVLGDCDIGNNVIISAGALLIDENIPDNCIVFGGSRDIVIKRRTAEEIRERARHIWKPD